MKKIITTLLIYVFLLIPSLCFGASWVKIADTSGASFILGSNAGDYRYIYTDVDLSGFNVSLLKVKATDGTNVLEGFSDSFGSGLAFGSDLVSGWDFTSGWSAGAGATINDADTFTTIGNDKRIYNIELLTSSALYQAVVAASTTASSYYFSSGGTWGTGDGTYYGNAGSVNFSIYNTDDGVTDVTSLQIKEVTDIPATAGFFTDSTFRGSLGWYDPDGINWKAITSATFYRYETRGMMGTGMDMR